MTQHGDSVGSESQTSNASIPSLKLYQLSSAHVTVKVQTQKCIDPDSAV